MLTVVLLTACSKEEKKNNNRSSTEKRNVHAQLPKKKSELNGWQGLKIEKDGAELCRLVFPENYGLANMAQLNWLRELVNSNLDHDLDCVLQVNYAALDQIKLLAAEKQDTDATAMLLDPKRYGGFDLDGELAEEYAGEYQLPVLEKSRKLTNFLENKQVVEQLTDSVCSWVEVSGEKKERNRVKALVQLLKRENFPLFTSMLSSKCGKCFE